MKTAVEWLAEQYNLVDTAEYEQAKEMEKQQKGYSDEEVNEIIAEAWNSCEDNEGEIFTEARKRILEQFKKK